MNASTVSSEHPEELLLSIARLAYRLGRQDQQRILELRIKNHGGSAVLLDLVRDLVKDMTDAGVDFTSIVRAAQRHSTAVNSASGGR